MTIASFLHRRRRLLALCAASALMHYVAIGWVGAHIADGDASTPPPVMQATLVAPPDLEAPAPPPPPPPPAPPKPRVAARPKAPPAAVAATSTADDDGAAITSATPGGDAPVAADPAVADQPKPDPVPPVPVAAPDPVPAPVAAAPDSKPAEPTAPAYRVSLPPSARLALDLARTDPDGTKWRGEAEMTWKHSASAYQLTVEGGVSVVFTRVNLIVLTSAGAIDEHGIAPRESTEKRRGRAQTATHFDAAAQRITFSASERSAALLPGTQDKATFPFQLAAIARADSAQLAAGVEMLVGEERDASPFHFTVLGQEEIDTPMGRLLTWHLSRPPRPGFYNARLDIWLAPQHHWFPVQFRNTETSGAVTTQTIRKIVLTEQE